MTVYEDKFIAFVDILGFTRLVERSEEGGDGAPTIEYILDLIGKFGSSTDEDFAKYGPTTCPCAPHNSRDLNFRVTQISDCAVISAEASPAGLINLIQHCYKIAFRFLKIGHLCRGYVTRGNIVHTEIHLFGTGYMRAFNREKTVSIFTRDATAVFGSAPTAARHSRKFHAAIAAARADHWNLRWVAAAVRACSSRLCAGLRCARPSPDTGTPFIEIDPKVFSYVAGQPDVCVKRVFDRLTESDGEIRAVWPLFALKMMPDMAINNESDLVIWKEHVQTVRQIILRLLSQLEESEVTANTGGRRKIEHLKIKLREVLAFKEQQLENGDFLIQPYPKKL